MSRLPRKHPRDATAQKAKDYLGTLISRYNSRPLTSPHPTIPSHCFMANSPACSPARPSGIRSWSFADDRVGVGSDDSERTLHRGVGPPKSFPQSGKCYGLIVPACDGVGLLAARDRLPLVESVSGDDTSALKEADLNMPEVLTVSARALIGRLACTGSLVKYGRRPHFNRSR